MAESAATVQGEASLPQIADLVDDHKGAWVGMCGSKVSCVFDALHYGASEG